MHYEEQRLMAQQLAESEKIIQRLKSVKTGKEYVACIREICEWLKKAPIDGEWQPLGDAYIRMMELAITIAE